MIGSLPLRSKLLVAVVLCAVLPLAAVGAWLTVAASNTGRRLLVAQLDSAATRAAETAAQRWEMRGADVALLAGNEPVRRALERPADKAAQSEATRYLDEALRSMPGISSVTITDASQRTRWSLGFAGVPGAPGDVRLGAPDVPRELAVSVPVRDEASGRTLGGVKAGIRLDAFLVPEAAVPGAASGFVAVHAISNNAWLVPAGVEPSQLANDTFTRDGREWAAVRRAVPGPNLELVAAAPTSAFTTALAGVTKAGAAALAVVGLAVILLTIAVTGRLTSSLRRLAEGADAVSSGALGTRVDVSSADEVGRVARTFNQMSARLQAMMDERSQREAVSAMGELAATFAHQVRSPATAMRLDLERVRARLGAGSDEEQLVARALDQLDRLERTATGSLRVARSSAVTLAPTAIATPLRRAIDGAGVEVAERDLQVAVTGIDEGALVSGDAPSLEQLFSNLILNAAQASPPRGRISVRVGTSDAAVTVSITDQGSGMSEATLARAGEPFFSTRPGGTGLGLAIARRIAAAHRAEWTMTSTSGAGTQVTLAFPMAGKERVP